MKVDARLFRSRLARRMFVAFVLCALLPVAVSGLLSYRSVTNQLVAQEASRLREASKSLGLSLYERLLFAETELVAISQALQLEPDTEVASVEGERIRRLAVVAGESGLPPIGEAETEFRRRQWTAHLEAGKSVLLPPTGDGQTKEVRLALRIETTDAASPLLVGVLDPVYFWGLEGGNSVPADAEFCVFQGSGDLIYASFEGCTEAWDAIDHSHLEAAGEEMEAIFPVGSVADELFVGGHRDLFLGARFMAQDWVIVVCEPKSAVIAPIARWRLFFPAAIVLVACSVLLLIISSIRSNLDPIDQLREATAKIAARDFDVELDLRTGDELEQLGDAVNRMAARLRRQFGALAATGKVHREMLSSLDMGKIVEVTVVGIRDYFEPDRAVAMVVEPGSGGAVRTAVTAGEGEPVIDGEFGISPELRSQLERVHPGTVIGHDMPESRELVSLLGLTEMETVVAVPAFRRGTLAALIGFGCRGSRQLLEEDLDHLIQIADQFAVALANARMLEEVNDFSLGTLEALARAVDAKSPWTAGHSERVTQLALAIGSVYGLDPFELSKLFRGAMLHDIGKLGISQVLLDKRGRLDRDEFNVVRSHTLIGERILEPVAAFAEIMPVVTQHHERWDGSGYPNGLIGSTIDIKARILAVADVYDAMTNPRPYRDSVDPHEVVEMIRSQAGTQFDPEVVDAFLQVIESRGGIEHLAMLKRDFSFFDRSVVGQRRTFGVFDMG